MRFPRTMGFILSVPLLMTACSSSKMDDGGVDQRGDSRIDGGLDSSVGDSSLADTSFDANVDSSRDANLVRDSGSQDAAIDAGFNLDGWVARLAALQNDDQASRLISELGWRGGLPLVEGNRVLFVRCGEGAGASDLRVASDLTGWDPGVAVDGRNSSAHCAWKVVTVANVSSIAGKYKWFYDGDFHAPAEATAFGFDQFGEFGWVSAPSTSYLGRFVWFSNHFSPSRFVRVRVPAIANRRVNQRVLLLHDGQNVFGPNGPNGGWQVNSVLEASAFADIFAVAIDNASDRFDAYTPFADTVGNSLVGGRSADYIDDAMNDVLPRIANRFGFSLHANRLAVAGSSLGGLVSLDFARRMNGQVRCVIAMSPTLGWGAYRSNGPDATFHQRWGSEVGHGSTRVYIDSGGQGTCSDPDSDGTFEDADDDDNYCVTKQFRDELFSLGYSNADLRYVHQVGAQHSESDWRGRFPAALQSCVEMGF